MTESVKTSVINLFSDAKTSKANSVKNTGNDFSSVMDSNLKSKSSTAQKDTTVKDTVNHSNASDKTENIRKDAASNANTTEVKPPADSTNSAKHTPDTVNTAKEQTDSIHTEDDESIYQYALNLLALLQNTIQDNLGITEEELNKAMESLGFTAADLLNPDNLKLLALQINGKADITQALTDESLANTINDLVQAVETFKTEQDITISPEKLNEIIKNPPISQDASPVTPQIVEETVTKDPEQPIRIQDDADTVTEDIKVEVYKTQDKNPQSESTESGSSKDTDDGQADIKTTSPIDLLVQNLAVKGNENSLSFTEQIANVRQMQDITNQIVDQIKITIKPEQTSMELQLNPESLGKINLSVVAKDGIMTAHFTAQNEMVKEAIESQIQILKDNLNNQRLKVESIEVTVSNFSFGQSNQTSDGSEKGQQNSSRNRNFDSGESDVYTNPNDETGQMAGTLEESGSSIDYTA